MAFKYEINGHMVEFDNEPTEADIDEAAQHFSQSNPEKSVGDFLTNKLPKSIGRAAESIAHPVLHPIETAKSIGNFGLGIVEKASPTIQVGKALGVIPKELPQERYVNGMIDFYKQRYGGMKNIADTAYNDPAGMALDVAMVAEPVTGMMRKGAVRGAIGVGNAAKGAVKTADKTATSVLRRTAGLESSDIKQIRDLGIENISKNKAKPEYLGSEIAPQAAELTHERVKGMDPEAMRAIGISSEDTGLAQRLKEKFGLEEFPTKASADEFYSRVLAETPNDIQIPTTNLEKALASNRLDPNTARMFKQVLDKTKLNEGGVLEKVPMTKQEYEGLRNVLNNVDPQGEIPSVQAVKGALDADFEIVQPRIGEAKGRFQLSRQVPKAEKYLDKTNAAKNMQSELKSAAQPENVQGRIDLRQKTGSDKIVNEVKAQRLAKELYKPAFKADIKNNPLDMISAPGRFGVRVYEQLRGKLTGTGKGRVPFEGIQSPMPKISKATEMAIAKNPEIAQDFSNLMRQKAADISFPDVPESPEVIPYDLPMSPIIKRLNKRK